MSLSSNWLFICDSKHPRIQMLAAFQICSSACSSEYCTKNCLVLWSFKYFLDLCRRYIGYHMPIVCPVSYSKCFYGLYIFFKVNMQRHLWWYCTHVISSLPMSLTMSRTGTTLDFCGFQQGFHESVYCSVTFRWAVENAIHTNFLPWLGAYTCSIRHAFKEYYQNL